MYKAFYNMEHTPFARNVPPQALYETPSMAEALSRLIYVADHQLFSVVVSDAGCGKTTLIRRFASELSKEKYILLYLSDSKMTPRWLYKGLLNQLGLEATINRGECKMMLQKEIEIIRQIHKKQIVCVLDEAHLLEKETLEEFRFLLNYNYDSVSPMALVLVGQTELWENKLKHRRYDAIRQRIDISCILPHLDRSETAQYIDSHLRYAGCNSDVFSDRAIDEIYKGSSGVLRQINRICEKSLMYGGQQQKRIIDDYMVHHILEHEAMTVGGAL